MADSITDCHCKCRVLQSLNTEIVKIVPAGFIIKLGMVGDVQTIACSGRIYTRPQGCVIEPCVSKQSIFWGHPKNFNSPQKLVFDNKSRFGYQDGMVIV